MLAVLAAACAVASGGGTDTRLPRTIIPTAMFIDLVVPDPNTLSLAYTGSVAFTLNVTASTPTITLHSHLLNWTAANCNLNVGKESVGVHAVTFNASTQFAVLTLARALTPADGVATLTINNFQAAFNSGDNGGSGFFLSNNTYSPGSLQEQPMPRKAKDENGWRRFPNTPTRPWLLADGAGAGDAVEQKKVEEKVEEAGATMEMMYGTQFEETDARRAFPCFDEPLFKVHVTTTITVPAGAGLVALANTMEVAAQPETFTTVTTVRTANGNKTSAVTMSKFTFKETKHPMSSYLVAFAVGRFDYVEANDAGVRIRIYTPPGKSAYGKFALDFTVKVLQFYSKSWGFPYSDMNDKMDQISVPSVVDNAMENWGLLTYFPSFLLVDSLSAPSLPSQQLIAQVTAHEISHQWFGDTITNEWWSSEYLQEGYARLWQYVSVDAIFPEWDVFNAIILGSPFGDIGFYGWPFNRGMDSDYDGKLPAPVVPDSQQASGTAFYEKGAAVNRMFSNYLGQNEWFAVLNAHLHKYEWSNPQLPNLLDSFKDDNLPPKPHFAGFNKKMASWLEQPGMPLVTLSVVKSSAGNGVDGSDGTDAGDGAQRRKGKYALSVSQQPSSKNIDQKQLWWVPLHVQLSSSTAATGGGAGGAAAGSLTRKDKGDTLFAELDQNTQHLTVPLPKEYDAETTMLYGNFNFSTFCLVNYTDPMQWKNLVTKMAEPSFPKIDRQQLQKQLTFLAALENGTTHSPSLGHLTALVRLYTADQGTSVLLGGLQSNVAATTDTATVPVAVAAAASAADRDYLLHMVDGLALMGRKLLCQTNANVGAVEFRAALVNAFEMMVKGEQAPQQVKDAALFWSGAFSNKTSAGVCELEM